MILKKLAVSAAIISLAASPVIAQTAKAPIEPQTERVEGASQMEGSSEPFGWVIAAGILAIIIYMLTHGDSKGGVITPPPPPPPTSP